MVQLPMDREHATVVFNRRERPHMWRLGLRWDALRRGACAARFVMLSFPDGLGPLLPRPFSISDVYSDADGIVTEFLYKPVGVGTRRLAALTTGDVVAVLGLLGNGFPDPQPGRRPVLVAGGIGNAPFAYQVRGLVAGAFAGRASEITLLLAGRNADEIYIQPVVRDLGATVVEITDDGSRGERGLVTEALGRRLANLGAIEVFACGPTPMLRAVQRMAWQHGFPCWLSVEELMACGYGVCNACVVESRPHPGTYHKACHEGPVFEAQEINA